MPHDLHGRVNQHPTHPGRSLLGNVIVMAVCSRLFDLGRQSRIRRGLFGGVKARDITPFGKQHQRGEGADTVQPQEGLAFGKPFAHRL